MLCDGFSLAVFLFFRGILNILKHPLPVWTFSGTQLTWCMFLVLLLCFFLIALLLELGLLLLCTYLLNCTLFPSSFTGILTRLNFGQSFFFLDVHRMFYPVNFEKFYRAIFSHSTSGRLLLDVLTSKTILEMNCTLAYLR